MKMLLIYEGEYKYNNRIFSGQGGKAVRVNKGQNYVSETDLKEMKKNEVFKALVKRKVIVVRNAEERSKGADDNKKAKKPKKKAPAKKAPRKVKS